MTTSTTYYGGNSWLIEIQGCKIIIDPWLKGDLVFPPGEWLIKGELESLREIPKDINLILLTQGLQDHAHEETLRLFKRSIPVIGSSKTEGLLKKIGFNNITILRPKMKINILGLEIIATAGAMVPFPENGYIIKSPGTSIYIEPHGFVDTNLKSQEIDIVISPVVNLGLPIAGDFIKGKEAIAKLISLFMPKYVLASTVGGEIKFTGLLSNYISQEGSFEESRTINSENCIFIDPIPGYEYKFNLRI